MNNDNRCPLCNFRISDRWAQHIVGVGREASRMLRKKFAGMILACPECLPPVVIPKVFR